MEYFIYILYSGASGQYYVGYTTDYNRRLSQHNHSVDLTFTSKHRPWELKAVFSCGMDKQLAIKTERFIKRQKSRKLIEKLISGDQLDGLLTELVRVPHMRD